MLQKEKIRIMTKLAIYDKKFGETDKRKNRFFKWDYVYFRNFRTRTGVLFGCIILSCFYIFNKIIVEQTDIFTLDLKAEGAKLGVYTLAAIVVYTIIGTLVSNAEYKKSRERLDEYFNLLESLDEISENDGTEKQAYVPGMNAGKRRRGADVKHKPPEHKSEKDLVYRPKNYNSQSPPDILSDKYASFEYERERREKMLREAEVRKAQQKPSGNNFTYTQSSYQYKSAPKVEDNNRRTERTFASDKKPEYNEKSIDLLMKLKGVKDDGTDDFFKDNNRNGV